MSNLAGKVALVSDSGRGIGRAIALKLARHGAKVAVNDLDCGPGDAVAAEIRTAGGEAIGILRAAAEPIRVFARQEGAEGGEVVNISSLAGL